MDPRPSLPVSESADSSVSFDLIKKKLQRLVAQASRDRATLPAEDYFASLMALESELRADYFAPDIADAIVDAPEMAETVERSRALFHEHARNMERSLLDAYRRMREDRRISVAEGSLLHHYLLKFRTLSRNEGVFMRLTAGDRVAFVGKGPIPISGLELVRSNDCRVDWIESDLETVEMARRIVRDQDLTSSMNVVHCAGEDFDYGDHSVVMVASFDSPDTDIMLRIAATAEPEARIFCRTTFGFRKMITMPFAMSLLWPYQPIAARFATGDQTLSTLALDII